MRISLLVNHHRADAQSAADRTARALEQQGIEVVYEDPIADLMITFGGDGTLIRAAHICSPHGTPVLGIYYGRFGFVTQCTPDELGAALSQFFDGDARIESRMMVETDLVRNGKTIESAYALNEISVQRATTTRMVNFEITVDGQFLTRYPADGVFVSTPTGSTAYNLSVGGPIVDPRVDALIMGAIAPHTLSARSLVFGKDSEIRIKIQTRGDAMLSADGLTRIELISGDEIHVRRAQRVTKLVCVDPTDFLTKVRDRLLWSNELPEDENNELA